MDLSDYLRVLRRNWVLMLAVTLAGLLAGGAAALLTKPTYTADTEIFVATQTAGSVQELQQGNTFTQARVQSYAKVVESPVVLQPVIDSLGLDINAEQLARRVEAKTDVNTVLLNISASDNSPVQAAAIAQSIANSLVQVVDGLEKPRTGGPSPVSLSIIKPAKAPSSPSEPNTRMDLLLGLVVGLVLGTVAAVLRTIFDTRIRGEAEVRAVTEAPLLGGISFDQGAVRKPLLTQAPSQSPRAESFRQLRTNLQFANVSGHAKTVLVTSSLPGEGKSTSAANLAIAMAQAGSSVCLVDADLRRPMISEYLGLERNAGLTTALVGAADVSDLLQGWGDDDLFVLTSGQIPPNPSELLGSQEMQQLIVQLETSFDAVIIDAPPLLPVTDAAVLSQFVGGVILVVGSQKLRKKDIEKSIAALQMVDANLLGIVLNRLPAKGPEAYTYTYYSNHEQVDATSGSSRRGGGANRSMQDNASATLAQEDEAAEVFPLSSTHRRRQ
ncbi:polysaccharide biosynthesis tyrosine autokinase [Arthrobacter nitrophenolicus]|uniref:polysaccharide biosynthesis tyrosine autokinase n=1 Tax=Arthrobacter nitrophenolicus TaxID=683150 RepID=UPI003899FA4E